MDDLDFGSKRISSGTQNFNNTGKLAQKKPAYRNDDFDDVDNILD